MRPNQHTVRFTIIIAASILIHAVIGLLGRMEAIIYKPNNEDSTTVVLRLKQKKEELKTEVQPEPEPVKALPNQAPKKESKATLKKPSAKQTTPKIAQKNTSTKPPVKNIKEQQPKKTKTHQKNLNSLKANAPKPKTPTAKTGQQPKQPAMIDQASVEFWTRKLGSMEQLDEQALNKTAIFTKANPNQYRKREKSGLEAFKALNRIEKQEFSNYLSLALKDILRNFSPPKKDGRKYYGEVRLLIDNKGYITGINLKTPSGNNELDFAMLSAAKNTVRLQIPRDPDIAAAFIELPKLLNYDETDMTD